MAVDQRSPTPPVPAETAKMRAHRPGIRRQQNQVLALVLASVAAGILFIVVALVVMLHLPEFRHALANL